MDLYNILQPQLRTQDQPQIPSFVPEWDLKAEKKTSIFPYDVYDVYDEFDDEKDEDMFLLDEY